MKRLLKYALRTLVGIVLLLVTLLVVSSDFRQMALGSVFDWLVISRIETSHPVSREKAGKYFRAGFLPVSAHDVQYANAGCIVSPAFETFLRFEAPVEDCLAHAKASYSDIPLEPISSVFKPEATMGVHAGWFDTDRIRHGFYGRSGKFNASIWIDTDRGVFYFFDTD